MLHGILEEHEVHHRVGIVVLSESFSESIRKLFKRTELIIFLLLKALDELSENEGLWVCALEVLGEIVLSEGLLDEVSNDGTVSDEVLW